MVTCDERDRHADFAIEHPVLVIEVLSATTAACDRGAKFAAYRKLESLNEIDGLLLPWKVDLVLRQHIDNPALLGHIECMNHPARSTR